jgi:G3E family GTPase
MPKTRYVMIGGFLGAGKTTALIAQARHLRAQGRRVGIITNDQSVNLVDTARVRAAGFPVMEITGGCFCCRFNSLIEASRRLIGQAAPDVLLAEPVGSCTDLLATVGYPLRQLYGDEFEVAPLSVLVDPIRCARILGIQSGKTFTDKVLYVYRKQLEEAELLVINKVDLLAAGDRRALTDAIRGQIPRARLLEISCQTGEGLADWFRAVLEDRGGNRATMDVDYDRYAEGEALLGWLNATARLQAAAPFDGNAWLAALALKLRDQFRQADYEIAHLKMVVLPDEGPDLAAVSVTQAQEQPHMTHTLRGALTQGRLTVNLRAQADPKELKEMLAAALAAAPPVTATLDGIQAFRPVRPTPMHRVAAPATAMSDPGGNR